MLKENCGLCRVTHNYVVSVWRTNSSATGASTAGLCIRRTSRSYTAVDAEGAQVSLVFSKHVTADIKVGLYVLWNLVGHHIRTQVTACPCIGSYLFGSGGERWAAIHMPSRPNLVLQCWCRNLGAMPCRWCMDTPTSMCGESFEGHARAIRILVEQDEDTVIVESDGGSRRVIN